MELQAYEGCYTPDFTAKGQRVARAFSNVEISFKLTTFLHLYRELFGRQAFDHVIRRFDDHTV